MSSVLTAAENFTVVVYKRGSTVNGAQSGTLTSLTVRNGALRWASGNKGMVGLTPGRYFTVNGTPANDTTIPINSISLSVLDGERLVNLGADTGGGTPNFDGSGVSIYSVNSDGATAISQSRVTTDGHGEYAYYTAVGHSAVDELILSGTTPVELIEDANIGSPHRVYSPEVDSASAVGHVLDTERVFNTSGAKMVSFRTGGIERASVDKDGRYLGDVTGADGAFSTLEADTLSVVSQATISGPLIAEGTLAVTGAATFVGTPTATVGFSAPALTATSTSSLGAATTTGLTVAGSIDATLAGAVHQFRGYSRMAYSAGGFGGFAGISANTEELTLAGTQTDSVANLLPANSIILAVTARVTSTIAGGAVADWTIEDTTTATRFADSTAALTAGTTVIGLKQWDPSEATTIAGPGPYQAAAAKVRINYTGTPSSGRVRVTVFYIEFNAPTS